MNDQRQWQRVTSLRKVEEARESARKDGVAIPDRALAAKAAAHVGATTDQVLAWMRGGV